ncbi:MAG: DUF1732 domain-containing protein, partial [Myxococcales bacterium]|nr:DUF1732 domain-containing protein [Myxococcales bacterium]
SVAFLQSALTNFIRNHPEVELEIHCDLSRELHRDLRADELDITEEVVRLRSHVDQFRAIVAEAGRATPVGRRLDFLLQEMGREANTTGSKANDAELAHFVVELKTELERVREQVQNVE